MDLVIMSEILLFRKRYLLSKVEKFLSQLHRVAIKENLILRQLEQLIIIPYFYHTKNCYLLMWRHVRLRS
jgi:hypothetical protein